MLGSGAAQPGEFVCPAARAEIQFSFGNALVAAFMASTFQEFCDA
jgi:hypothetical protein